MKKLAILVYPQFSLKEIGDIMYLFRWGLNTETDLISVSKEPVVSEEGVSVIPDLCVDAFDSSHYHCLVLPGCSDFRPSIGDERLIDFLKTFQTKPDFLIGALCGGPLFLALAGLLEDRKFTNSLFHEMNQMFLCINTENLVYAPLVEDANVITATGDNTRRFAIALARRCGFECSDSAMMEVGETWNRDDFVHHLSPEDFVVFKEEFKPYISD